MMKVVIGDIIEPMAKGARNNNPRNIHGFFLLIGLVINQIAHLFKKPVFDNI